MSRPSQPSRLDRISTSWTLLAQAHAAARDTAAIARALLVERYRGAVRRYLGALLRDDEAAEDLTQEFGLALIEGKLAKATPDRGRFRDYIKAVVLHLVSRHRKQQRRLPRQVGEDADRAVAADPGDATFVQSWRDELLARSWEALSQAHHGYFSVLHYRAAHPDAAIDEMIAGLSAQLGRKLSAEALRQMLHRARAMFAELLLTLVAQSLRDPSDEAIERELADLNLLSYCRATVAKRRAGSQSLT
jgi:DNA-directed RNA polymerase specialized sigma24 family protein